MKAKQLKGKYSWDDTQCTCANRLGSEATDTVIFQYFFFKSNLVKDKLKQQAPNYWKECSGDSADQWFDQTHVICKTGHIIDNPGSSRSIPEYCCDTKLNRQEEK